MNNKDIKEKDQNSLDKLEVIKKKFETKNVDVPTDLQKKITEVQEELNEINRFDNESPNDK